MTLAVFLSNLTKKFPVFNKDSEIEDIGEFLNPLTDEDRQRIWDNFRDTYTLVSAPRRAVFVTMADKMGIFRPVYKSSYEFVCYVCDIRYRLSLTTCPKCGNSDKTWRSVIKVGAQRSGKLKGELDNERNEIHERKQGQFL